MLKMKEKVKKIRYMTQKEIPRSMMTSKNMKRSEEQNQTMNPEEVHIINDERERRDKEALQDQVSVEEMEEE